MESQQVISDDAAALASHILGLKKVAVANRVVPVKNKKKVELEQIPAMVEQ